MALALAACVSVPSAAVWAGYPAASLAKESSAAPAESPEGSASEQPAPTEGASPTAEVNVIVAAAATEEPPLAVSWQASGPPPSRPCSYSPSIAPDGRIWVAVCWDSTFWIIDPNGNYLETWGTPGTDEGQFDFGYPATHDSIGGIAFAPDGTFYTFDAGNLRVQHFGADRKLLAAWGGFGTDPGQFVKPTSIAVDAQGEAYVADSSRGDVQVFAPDGTFIRSIGDGSIGNTGFAYITVDREGNVFTNQEGAVEKFGPDGTPVATYDISAIAWDPAGMAVAPDGSLFLVARGDQQPEATIEFASDGTVTHVWPGTGESIAVDPDGTGIVVADVHWPFIRRLALPGR